jgi:hypothetical protein
LDVGGRREMKLIIPCHQCVQQSPPPSRFSLAELPPQFNFVELRDDNLYQVVCHGGHENVIFLQNPKFELLFESGALAFLDGHAREAVSSIASALERFYEFYIRIISFEREISIDEYNKTWKLVKGASERQLGGFLFLYLFVEKQSPVFEFQKNSEFRNKVIHQGYIPSTDETMKYCEDVMNFILSTTKRLEENHADSLDRVIRYDLASLTSQSSSKHPTTTMALATIVRVHLSRDDSPRSFRQALNALQSFRPYG